MNPTKRGQALAASAERWAETAEAVIRETALRSYGASPAELANPLVFFAIVIALFPLAVGPETQLLQTLSPGLVWVAALLAVLLSLVMGMSLRRAST